jgi:hypothetical protein
VLIQSVIQCAFAVVIYKFIVQRRGTTGAYLLGWAVIVPIAIYLPFFFLEFLDLRNKVIALSASTLMTVICFRCIEAMYNTSPDVVETSIENYIAYYSSIVPFVWDSKTKERKKITASELISSFVGILVFFTATSLLLSFLMYTNYRPFDSPVRLDGMEWSIDLLTPAHIGNAYFHVLLLYCTLKTGFDLTAFGENLKGVASQKIFDSPFVGTRSLTDFWTNRWNRMIQQVLKVSKRFAKCFLKSACTCRRRSLLMTLACPRAESFYHPNNSSTSNLQFS